LSPSHPGQLGQALKQPDEQQTPLQRRALIAIGLLRQAWLSWQPEIAFLSVVMALERLLDEPSTAAANSYLISIYCKDV
jgi:hypothetical protein